MRQKTHRWLRRVAAAVMICHLAMGFSHGVEAQETRTLKIKSIKPVPELKKPKIESSAAVRPRTVVTTTQPDDEIQIDGFGQLDGINPESNEIVIDDTSQKVAPNATFFIGSRGYNRLPVDYEIGSRVAYRLHPETYELMELRLYKDVKDIIEDD